MATVHPCRKDRHNYQEIAGAAGLDRRSCTICGAVQIDLQPHAEQAGEGLSVFSARRPTLFTLRSETVPDETVTVSAGFGTKSRRRQR